MGLPATEMVPYQFLVPYKELILNKLPTLCELHRRPWHLGSHTLDVYSRTPSSDLFPPVLRSKRIEKNSSVTKGVRMVWGKGTHYVVTIHTYFWKRQARVENIFRSAQGACLDK